ARCESRHSPRPLLPNFFLPTLVLPTPRLPNFDKPIRDTETFLPAPSRSTHSRAAPQKSGPEGQTRKSNPPPPTNCVAPVRGKGDDRLRRPWQGAAPQPSTIRPQF